MSRDDLIKQGVSYGLGYEELQILPLPKLREKVAKAAPPPPSRSELRKQQKAKIPALKLPPPQMDIATPKEITPKKELTVVQGDELLLRYKDILGIIDGIVKAESTNQELIREFASLWHDADKQAFDVECKCLKDQKVELAKEALDIQKQWGDSLVERKHAYMMVIDNFSNTSGRVVDYVRKQLNELEGVLVRFDEDRLHFNEITSPFPHYEMAVTVPPPKSVQTLSDRSKLVSDRSKYYNYETQQSLPDRHDMRPSSIFGHNNNNLDLDDELHIE